MKKQLFRTMVAALVFVLGAVYLSNFMVEWLYEGESLKTYFAMHSNKAAAEKFSPRFAGVEKTTAKLDLLVGTSNMLPNNRSRDLADPPTKPTTTSRNKSLSKKAEPYAWQSLFFVDNDGVNAATDLDDDNDGILDTNEVNSSLGFARAVNENIGNNTTSTAVFEENGETNTVTIRGSQGARVTGVGNAIALAESRNAGVNPGQVGGIITISFEKPMYNLKFYIDGLVTGDMGDFSVTTADGNTSSNVNFTLSNLPAGFNFKGSPVNTGTLDKRNAGGIHYVRDSGGNVPQGSGIITFPSESTGINAAKGITSFSFRWLAVSDGGGPYTVRTFLEGDWGRDTDGDNIPNHLDLDSDGDGCPDALEGDGSINYPALSASTAIAGAVSATGIPTAAGAGQGVGQAYNAANGGDCLCNPATYNVPDVDGDNISDFCDLDNDNDGILDAAEKDACGIFGDPNFDGANAGATSAYDNFSAVFPAASPWQNSNGSAGYFSTQNNNIVTNYLSPYSGNGYVGFHSQGGASNEVFRNNLTSNMTSGSTYEINFAAYQMNLPSAYPFSNPGRIHFYGIRQGSNPTLDGNTQASVTTIAAIPGVDLLGVSELVDNTAAWELYSIKFTASQNYDRVIISIDGTDSFIGFDDIRVLCERDTDSDGIPDHLDLDSDADNCPDALEGAANILYPALKADTSINGAVSATGIPVAVGNGQGAGEAHNAANGSDCLCDPSTYNVPDIDGDDVSDLCDLDNDNDGILDTVECASNTSSVSIQIGGTTNSDTGGYPVSASANGVSGNSNVIKSTFNINATIASGDVLDRCEVEFRVGNFDDGLKVTIDGTVVLNFDQSHWDATNLGASTTAFNANGKFDTNNNGIWEPWAGEGNLVVVVNNNGVSLMVDTKSGGRENVLDHMDSSKANWVRSKTIAYNCVSGVVAEIENANFTGYTAINGVQGFANLYVCGDTDNDGIPNARDLDSDNDGCADALEGAANILYPALKADTSIDGSVSATGIPNAAGNGQGAGEAYNASIGTDCLCDPATSGAPDQDGDDISDFCDLDSDNDGILDTDEKDACGIFGDPGFEGANAGAGSGYDNFGTVFPANSAWQNSNGTAGYFNAQGTALATNYLSPHNGNGYMGFHSQGGAANEVFRNNLVSNINSGRSYEISFAAYQMNLPSPPYPFTNPGRIHFFGVREGTNPTFNGANQANPTTIAAIANVDLLGVSDLVDNTAAWELFSIKFVALQTYDQIIISIDGNNSFIGFDDIRVLCERDTDSDGIPDHLDLDSDADGCPDAIEGAASILFPALKADTSINGAVSATGIPVAAGNGQGAGEAYNASIGTDCLCDPAASGAPDLDGDDLADHCDDDIDNDGILNTVECGINTSSIAIEIGGNTTRVTGGYPVSASANGNSGNSNGVKSTFNINGSIFPGNIMDRCEVEFQVGGIDDGLQVTIDGTVVLSFNQDNWDADRGASTTEFDPGGRFDVNNNGSWEPWVGEGNPVVVVRNSGVSLMVDTRSGGREDALQHMDASKADWVRSQGIAFNCLTGVVAEIENTNAFGPSGINGVQATANLYVCADIDNDGIPNSMDTDTDNDGCPDAIEGAGSFTDADLSSSDRLLGNVNANGVPTIAGSPQGSTTAVLLSDTVTISTHPQNIEICENTNASFTVAATASSTLNYQWQVNTGSGTFNDIPIGGVYSGVTAATLNLTNVPESFNNYRYRAVVYSNNRTCDVISNGAVLTVSANPTVSAAGSDIEQCNTTSFTMAANAPTVGTGVWTLVSGTATIANANSNTTSVTVAAGDTTTLRWTISNGNCTASTDDVVLTNHALPTTANAGSDIEQCNTTSFTMAGNAPTVGTGVWTLVSGTATIANANSNTTSVTVAAGDTATLRWSISNGSCTASTDDVVLTNHALPTTANAGSDIEQCNTTGFTMAGNAPTVGTGVWTLVSGTATIANANSNNTSVTVAAGDTATLRWTISNGNCTASTDDVVLTNHALPTTANAGSDIEQCNTTS
ncbi:MAG: hypothetical protein OIF50_10290, partial [Flavobacteriaceae bacterium]|nr:hypothetical protein [Flavobacteriaceae bacterium]